MNLFKNSVILRGFLGREAEVPNSNRIRHDSFAALVLGVASGNWKQRTSEWESRTEWYPIICPGPYFCGFTRGMQKGEYLEVTGELHPSASGRSVTIADEKFPFPQSSYEVHALAIRRLEIPAIGVDLSDDVDDT